MTESESRRRIPTDSFRVRLAIVRAEMGWNYDQAQAATGIKSESWRLWEKGQRHCTDVTGVSRKISEVTPYDPVWLVMGGPLEAEGAEALLRPRTARSAPARKAAHITRVRKGSNHECSALKRRPMVHPVAHCGLVAA